MNLRRLFAKKEPAPKRAYALIGYGTNAMEGYLNSDMPYEDPDEIVGQHGVEIFRTMYRRDDMVKAAISYRQLAALSTGWQMKPASDDEKDVEAAECLEWGIKRMRGSFSQDLQSILDAEAMGFSVHEKVWAKRETTGPWVGKQFYAYLKHRNPVYIKFRLDKHGEIESILQEATLTSSSDYVELKREDVIYHVHQLRDDNPYGSSPLRGAYRYYFGKEGAYREWLKYLEIHGRPLVLGRHPPGADSDYKAILLDFIKQLRNNSAATAPEDWKIDVHESNHSAHVALFQNILLESNRGIARSCLLPTLVLENAETGAYALGKEHNDQFTWILNADREALENIINEELIKPLFEWNFPPSVGMPIWELNKFAKEDLESLARMAKLIIDCGKSIPESWFDDRFGIPQASEEEEIIGGKSTAGSPEDEIGDEPFGGTGELAPEDIEEVEGEPKTVALESKDWAGTKAAQRKFPLIKCASCGATRNLQRHHRDGDPSNNLAENVIILCSTCHARFEARRHKKFRAALPLEKIGNLDPADDNGAAATTLGAQIAGVTLEEIADILEQDPGKADGALRQG